MENFKQEVLEQALERILDMDGQHASDVHHELFNTDYFVIGTSLAKEKLEEYGTFNAIEKIQTYEKDNFGEVTTDLGDAEKVCNMLAYIIGEEILGESETLRDVWDNVLTETNCKEIKNELKNLED